MVADDDDEDDSDFVEGSAKVGVELSPVAAFDALLV